jgi:hypothetical protein
VDLSRRIPVERFGTSSGIVLIDRRVASEEARVMIRQRGMTYSLIDVEAYGQYDRDLFIASLDDWGWFGKRAKQPQWYSGTTWS